MTFTDEDLERVKRGVVRHGDEIMSYDAERLIARLEAAEALIGLENGVNFRRLYGVWRKAAGK